LVFAASVFTSAAPPSGGELWPRADRFGHPADSSGGACGPDHETDGDAHDRADDGADNGCVAAGEAGLAVLLAFVLGGVRLGFGLLGRELGLDRVAVRLLLVLLQGVCQW
jgi:hypothetical protein